MACYCFACMNHAHSPAPFFAENRVSVSMHGSAHACPTGSSRWHKIAYICIYYARHWASPCVHVYTISMGAHAHASHAHASWGRANLRIYILCTDIYQYEYFKAIPTRMQVCMH